MCTRRHVQRRIGIRRGLICLLYRIYAQVKVPCYFTIAHIGFGQHRDIVTVESQVVRRREFRQGVRRGIGNIAG